MSKLNKPEYVADKIRDSLKIEANKPDKINVNLGSPITPLQNQPSGLTTSTSSFTSSSSSGSVTGHASHSTRTYSRAAKSKKTQSTTQSGSSNYSLKSTARNIRPVQDSVLDKTGKTSVLSNQHVKKFPTGNLVPSGKVRITGMTQEKPRSMMLRPKNDKSYGYGNIMRGNNLSPSATMSGGSSLVVSSPAEVEDTYWKIAIHGSNPEEVKRIGNEMFKKGCFSEALKLYDRAIQLSPTNPFYRTNRAAALSNLDQIGEAVKECEKTIKLDPKFARAHHRLALLFLRLGCVDNAWKHLYSGEKTYDPREVEKFEKVDKQLDRCRNARRAGEWNIVLREVSAAMESGADSSPQLAMCKVEALLKLLQLDDAQRVLETVPKVEPFPASISQTRFFDMISEAYTYFVKSQMELALGRFENAVTIAEKASDIDPHNTEVRILYKNVRSIARARDRGNHLYELERYSEASSAYGEGLKFDSYNATLLCYRAECLFKFGMWESSIKDCNHALLTLPSYTKPRLQRAASYSKLERWAEAVSDYEFLRKKLPYDKEIAESLFHAQIALRKSRGEIVLNMEFGCGVEEITSVEDLKSALTRPGVSVVHFCRASDQQCKEMSSFMDDLCVRYPSLHFLKVEIDKCPEVGDAEKVRVVPTFKIYKLGVRMKEIVCPSKEAVEKTVRHYGL